MVGKTDTRRLRGRMRTDFFLLLFVSTLPFVPLAGQCTLTCNSLSNVSLDQNGQATITADMVAQNPYNPNNCTPPDPQFFEVTVMLPNGSTIPTNPVVNCSHLNKTLTVKVKHLPSGNNCWGNIHVEDHLAPVFNCADRLVSCNLSDISPSNPAIGSPSVSDNCDASLTISHSDVFTDLPCGQNVNGLPIAAYVTRTWVASDDSGNSKTCVQHVWLERRTIADVVFPLDRDGFAAPFLNCENPNTNPSNTGFPEIDGQPVDGYCELSYTFSDQTIPACGSSKTILRTWTALDWCSSQLRTDMQIIHIKDVTPPTVACPDDLTVSTDPNDCLASVALPAIQTSDACSQQVAVRITSSFGVIDGNGGIQNNVPTGRHDFTYTATDACANTRTCLLQVSVEDQIAPTAICDGDLVVALGSGGTSQVMATSLDNGSFDNCCADPDLILTGRRMDDTIFLNKIPFNCSHLGVPQTAILRVTDCDGNYSECYTDVVVQDKLKPSISCPSNVSVNCSVFSVNNLSAHGMATASDNCSTPFVFELPPQTGNLTGCGTGFVTRRFQATDGGGLTNVCAQTVTVQNPTPWDGTKNIVWPGDFSTNQCATSPASLAPDSLPAGKKVPTINGRSGCNQVAYSFEDQVFNIAPPSCFKIFRKWKVVDWCQYNLNNPTGPGQWTQTQTITVMDNAAPVFAGPAADLTVETGSNCRATVTIPQPTTQDCSPNVTVTASSPWGAGFGPFPNVPIGRYPVTLRATDGCGNVAIRTFNVVVKDLKPPTAICRNGLSISLMQSGMVAIWARDFNAGSYDNCAPTSRLKFSFSNNPADTGKVFNCQNLGTNVLDMWVTDTSGNRAFCSTYVIIQDNAGACSPTHATVAGAVRTALNQQKLAGVTLKIGGTNALPDFVTDTSGSFAFPGLPVNVPYTITPRKNDGWLNGISTFDLLLISKHILGLQLLDSPYKIIAADANRSGTVTTFDVVTLRKLILGIIDTLPNNTSWRFVDAAYQFPNPALPFSPAFPTSKNFTALDPFGGVADFVAVKTGDVNGTASPNQLDASDDRDEVGNWKLEIGNWSAEDGNWKLKIENWSAEDGNWKLKIENWSAEDGNWKLKIGNFGEEADEALTFLIENQRFEKNQTLAVPVRASNFEKLEGYQFSLDFDRSKLRFDSVGGFGLEGLSAENFGLRRAASGQLSGNWENSSGETHFVENQIFTLHFTALEAGEMSEVLHAGAPDFLKSEGYRAGRVVPLRFVFFEKNQSENQPSAALPELRQNTPNPFSDETQISFHLPATSTAQLGIFDGAGRQVFEKTFENVSGEQRLRLRRTDLPGRGVFYYRLKTAEGSWMRKLICF